MKQVWKGGIQKPIIRQSLYLKPFYVCIISFNLHKLPKKPVLLSHIMHEKTEAQRVYH